MEVQACFAGVLVCYAAGTAADLSTSCTRRTVAVYSQLQNGSCIGIDTATQEDIHSVCQHAARAYCTVAVGVFTAASDEAKHWEQPIGRERFMNWPLYKDKDRIRSG